MSDLAAACRDLAAWLPQAAALLAEPDTTGQPARSSAAHSAPPWNPAAADALYGAHAAIRDLEAELRQQVTGRAAHLARRPGWSDRNTVAALGAISALGEAADPVTAARAARELDRALTQIEALPAVDLAELSRRVPAACPYCGFGMLRVVMSGPHMGWVACLRGGACLDADGQPPRGEITVTALNGECVAWRDGLVT